MAKSNKFGTFGGVFTPSILTILGVIMYLRLPMIIGEAGLYATLGIIIIAHIISATTGLSVSSIATDKKVEAGGTYFMISRSLGLPIGGTLGLALFVGLSFSVSLYLIGFAESFLGFWGMEVSKDMIRLTGSIILILVTIITFISTSLAIKAQYFIMAAIILSLLSILFGNHDYTPAAPTLINSESTIPLMVLFGIFFPAVTGFEAGVSMSGDLKDPKKSIPSGSLMAIIVGLIVYILLALFFSYTVDGNMLATEPNILLKISWVPGLVIAGIWGATLSSALGSILGAPRILQATAIDKITPKFFSKGFGPSNEPRNALLLTFIIAEAGILIGELDVIARIVSIFFITTYGFLNLSCAFEAWTSADFRPEFKTPIWVSLLGATACIVVMIQLDFLAMIGATVILGSLFLYLKRKELSLDSGDTWSGVWASLVKSGLQKLNKSSQHTRNWRPNIIMFKGDDQARPHLIEMGKSIAGKLGILTGFELTESQEGILGKPQAIPTSDVEGYFTYKHLCHDIYSGMDEIARIYGFSGIHPNTILMGWSKKENQRDKFGQLIRVFEKNGYNSIFLNFNKERKYGNHKTIDVWWNGWGRNLSFAINLIRHITSKNTWKSARLRLLIINNDNTQTEKIYKTLERILDNYRVDVTVKVINNEMDNLPKDEIIVNESQGTDLTILGILDTHYQKPEQTVVYLDQIMRALGTTLLINASTSFEEYELGIEHQRQGSTLNDRKDEILTLPILKPSKYPIIAADIDKIDNNGQKLLETFYDKTFTPYFAENQKVIDEFRSLSKSTFSVVGKSLKHKDTFRRNKALMKIRNDFYFRSKALIEGLGNERLDLLKEVIESGIGWYIEKLATDIVRFPQRLTVPYDRAEFKIDSKDPTKLKLYKIGKRIIYPFSGQLIPGKIRYREIARYYLHDNRHHFLKAILQEFEQSTLSFLFHLKAVMSAMGELLEDLEKKIKSGEIENKYLAEKEKIELDRIHEFAVNQQNIHRLFKNRFLVEFRINLQMLSNDLERVNINELISKKRKGKKFYRSVIEQNKGFTENWHESMKHQSNRVYIQILLLSLKSRIKDELNEFKLEVSQLFDQNLLKKIAKVKSFLKSSDFEVHNLKFDVSADNSVPVADSFNTKKEEIIALVSQLPDQIIVSENDGTRQGVSELIEIPLEKITNHFIEARFFGPGLDFMETSERSVRNAIYNIKDHISLARFNIENIEQNPTDEDTDSTKIIEDTRKEIDDSEAKIRKIMVEITDHIYADLDGAFEPLATHAIAESSLEFSQSVRDYQSKKVMTRFDAFAENLRTLFKRKSAKLFYSRSEGILLAQRFTQEESMQGTSVKVLDMVDKVSPDPAVLNQLPHYYRNLFSGRSSISDDFWIERKVEKDRFEKAIRRYQEGYSGGIMVLGEKNTGKTSFCKYISEKMLSKNKIYHLFPPRKGSSDPNDFKKELEKISGIRGEVDDIINLMQHDSTLVIHDLEMWWERSDHGFKVIEQVIDLINHYSNQYLFIVNMNIYTFNLINQIYPLEAPFIEIIRCLPFDAQSLKNLIMLRHHSSGMKFHLGKKDEDSISEIKLARLFNRYFDYSGGNPGVALDAWLNNIVKVSGKSLTIKYPEIIELTALENIDEDWIIILEQFILHKKLTYEKLQNILGIESQEILEFIRSLKRCGLLQENIPGVYSINSHIEPHIINMLKGKELL